MSRPDVGQEGWPGDWPVHRLGVLLSRLESSLSSASTESAAILSEAKALTNGLDDYLSARSTPVPGIVEDMVKATDEEDWAGLYEAGKTRFKLGANMCAGTYEAGVLRALAAMLRAETVLEVGMFTGTSTLAVALLPRVKRVVALEFEGFLDGWTRPWFDRAGVGQKVDVRLGDARQTLDGLKGQSFDLVFVDADKASYEAYYRQIIDHRLLSPNGALVLDNTLYKGAIWAPHPMFDDAAKDVEAANKAIYDDDRVESVILPIRDGVSIVRWKD